MLKPGQRPRLVLTHIPKSAGTSLRHSLIAATQAEQVVAGFDRSLFGGFRNFDAFEPQVRAIVALAPEELPAAPDIVCGHYASSTTRARYPEAPHITVLREARARLLSHWTYWRCASPGHAPGWGGWENYVAKATGSLADFLSDPMIAGQVDNVGLRMLLWPHPLIRDEAFIAESDDAELLALAIKALDGFDFVDYIENPLFESRLAQWIGGDFRLQRVNETTPVPAELCAPLERMFTPEAMTALAQRARLDDALWRYVVGKHLAPATVEALREAAFAAAIARHARLMEGPALTEAKAAPPEPEPQPELQPEPEPAPAPEPEPEPAPEPAPPPPPRRSLLAGLPWPFRARR